MPGAECNQTPMHTAPRCALFGLALLTTACLEDPGPTVDVGSTTHAIAPPIEWDVGSVSSNATATGNDISKNTGTSQAWDAGAVSVQAIESRGFVKFKAGEVAKNKGAGLNHDNTSHEMADIDFAIYLHSDESVTVRESGSHKGSYGTYDTNDIFTIDVKHTPSGAVVTYAQNGDVFYESTATPSFPLWFDTALYGPGATITDVRMTDLVHVATQNSPLVSVTPPTPPRLGCGTNDVIVITGKYLGSGADLEDESEITDEEFIDYEAPEWNGAGSLALLLDDSTNPDSKAYLQKFPQMAAYAGENGLPITLILDIESPGPRGLWSHTPAEQYDIVEAYKRRIEVVKDRFPQAKVGLFQTLNPSNTGVVTDEHYDDRHDALVAAGAQGLYTDLDYLVPVLYVRFGCDEDPTTPEVCDADWDTLEAYTELGIDGSRDLDGAANLPLLPFLTVYVHNTTSTFHGKMLRDLEIADPLYATLGAQLDILSDKNVDQVALWIGAGVNYDDDGDPETDDAKLEAGPAPNDEHVPPWTIDDYACAF